MLFTIEDFLDLDILEEACVKTSIETVNDRFIESISVTELPVENFVHKNELVLTTCMGCNNDTGVFKSFVKDVHQSGASALVISVGRYVMETPQEVIDFANELNFPIIEIPWKIRFANIIETVLLEINNIKQSNLKYFEQLQKKLLTYFLNGSTLTEAAELIYRELGNQVVIASAAGTIKGISNNSEEFVNILAPPLKILASGKNLDSLDTFNFRDKYTVYKISSKNIVYGYLYLRTLYKTIENDYVKDNKTFVVRHIVSPISLWFDREQTIFETEMHHQDNFVWNLIKGDKKELNELHTQAKSIGYELSLPYICIVGNISNLEKCYHMERFNYSSYEAWKFNCIKSIKSYILRTSRAKGQSVMTTYQEERLIIFLEIRSNNIEIEANNFLDVIETQLKLICPKLVISWGISENKVHNYSFNKAFLDAKISLEILHNEKEPGYRNIYHNTSIYRLLSILSNDQDTQTIIMDIIGNLIQHDSENNLELIHTFKTYIKNKGNVSKTARTLHLHRQSLLYRLKRIEEITELSLDNADDVFLLELCIRLWDKKDKLLI